MRRTSEEMLKIWPECRSAVFPFDALVKATPAYSKEAETMRFLTMVKGAENAGPPPQALMDAIAKLGEEAAIAGVLVETGALGPSMLGARIRISTGKLNLAEGPFGQDENLVGGYA